MAVKARLTSQTTVSFSGIDANILLGGADSPFTVMLLRVQPGHGAPNHISEFEDKLFRVDSGHFRFVVEDEVLDVETGDYVFAHKGAVHGFAAIGSVSMLTLVSTPSGHEKFFEDLSRLPTPHTPEAVSAVSEANKQLIVGPVVSV